MNPEPHGNSTEKKERGARTSPVSSFFPELLQIIILMYRQPPAVLHYTPVQVLRIFDQQQAPVPILMAGGYRRHPSDSSAA